MQKREISFHLMCESFTHLNKFRQGPAFKISEFPFKGSFTFGTQITNYQTETNILNRRQFEEFFQKTLFLKVFSMDSMSHCSFLFQGLLIFDGKLSNIVEIIAFQHCHSNTFLSAVSTISPNLKRTISLQDQNSLYWKSCVCIVSHLCSLDSLFLVLLLTLLVQSRSVFPAQSNCMDHKNRIEGIARTLYKEADNLLKSYVSTRLVIFSQAESVFLSYRLQSVTTLGLNVSIKCVPCHSYWKTLTAPTALTFYRIGVDSLSILFCSQSL